MASSVPSILRDGEKYQGRQSNERIFLEFWSGELKFTRLLFRTKRDLACPTRPAQHTIQDTLPGPLNPQAVILPGIPQIRHCHTQHCTLNLSTLTLTLSTLQKFLNTLIFSVHTHSVKVLIRVLVWLRLSIRA